VNELHLNNSLVVATSTCRQGWKAYSRELKRLMSRGRGDRCTAGLTPLDMASIFTLCVLPQCGDRNYSVTVKLKLLLTVAPSKLLRNGSRASPASAEEPEAHVTAASDTPERSTSVRDRMNERAVALLATEVSGAAPASAPVAWPSGPRGAPSGRPLSLLIGALVHRGAVSPTTARQ
jgi:hypothetical protein